MPGRRNLARERAQHALEQPRRQAHIYSLLRSQLPELDRALVGWPPILDHFARLGLRRLNGRPLNRRIVNAWRVHHTCPILRGGWRYQARIAPVSSSFALTSWILSQFDTADLFTTVDMAHPLAQAGSFAPTPCTHAA